MEKSQLYPNDTFHNPKIPTTRKNPRAEEFECGFLKTRDKNRLFFRGWRLKNITEPKNPQIILHIHGMVSHSEPYIALADGIVSEKRIVYGLDLEGHGHSQGSRGDYKSYQVFLNNIHDTLQFLHGKFPNSQFILSGESMGGIMVGLYLLLNPSKKSLFPIEKGLLWAPAFKPIAKWKDILSGIGIPFRLLFMPGRATIPVKHENTFRDPASLELDIEDPMNLSGISARYLWNIQKAINHFKKEMKSTTWEYPICLIQGMDDRIVSHSGSKKVFDQIATHPDSKFISVPEAWHCIYKDPAFSNQYWQQLHAFCDNGLEFKK